MSLHDLPFGTITAILERIAQIQGRDFRGSQLARYHTACPWHDGKRDSLAIDNQNNGWTCFKQCGKGGILAAVIRLAPQIGMDRRSVLEWLVAEKLIPPAETPTWRTPQEQFEIDVARRCTRNGVQYPSTTAVRNAARRVHLPNEQMEREPWWEISDPVLNADSLREQAVIATLHEIGSIVLCFDMERVRDAIAVEPAAVTFAQVRADDLTQNPHAAPHRVHLANARALARVARRLSHDVKPIECYVDAHAAALFAPNAPSGSRTWFDPTGTLPARRYEAYQYALMNAEERDGRPWHMIEHELHADTERQKRWIAWIDGAAGTRAS